MELPITFERTMYRAVIRYKQEHPGALEARTKERKEKERRELGEQVPQFLPGGH